VLVEAALSTDGADADGSLSSRVSVRILAANLGIGRESAGRAVAVLVAAGVLGRVGVERGPGGRFGPARREWCLPDGVSVAVTAVAGESVPGETLAGGAAAGATATVAGASADDEGGVGRGLDVLPLTFPRGRRVAHGLRSIGMSSREMAHVQQALWGCTNRVRVAALTRCDGSRCLNSYRAMKAATCAVVNESADAECAASQSRPAAWRSVSRAPRYPGRKDALVM
jgi:hypothetical protein